ncbi:hypothetical protein DSUL_150098 [Desulfovibrionales bacterium]
MPKLSAKSFTVSDLATLWLVRACIGGLISFVTVVCLADMVGRSRWLSSQPDRDIRSHGSKFSTRQRKYTVFT